MSKSFFFTLLLGFVAFSVFSDPALANDSSTTASSAGDGSTQLEATMCNVISFLTGNIGKSIAALAIIFIGVSLFMGKVSWGLAISTAMGIGAIFGAASLVDVISGSDATTCE